jgi:poly(hydroxyalkanoate) granule associated protein phasin
MTTKKKVRPAAKARPAAQALRENWDGATRAFGELRHKVERERKNAARQIAGQLARLQARLNQERESLGRRMDDTVHRALIAFDIPSRQEVRRLTRKVDELSRRIGPLPGGGRRVSVRKAARRAAR